MLKNIVRKVIILSGIMSVFIISLNYSYLLFHIFIELFSIVVAFSLFIITWNSRNTLTNQYLFFIGLSAFFIGILDILHLITFEGMNIIHSQIFYANQFWIATRFLESAAMLIGFCFLKRKSKINPDIIVVILGIITILIILSIFHWQIFPVCYIKDVGLTPFKIYSEYFIILILIISLWLLIKNKSSFDNHVFKLLAFSIVFAIISEFCFTLYISNYGFANQLGHFAKLITFYLIYKANVETGFTKPTETIFKNLKDSEERFRKQSNDLAELNIKYAEANEELKSNNFEIHLLNDDLAEKNEQLRELIATKDKFFSIIAHDLKNPFNTLIGFCNILVNDAENLTLPEIQNITQELYDASNQTYDLLINLLEWSNLQRGKISPDREKIRPSDIIHEVKSLCEPASNAKNIKIVVDCSYDGFIVADKEMIKSVMRNLITNAIKFSYPQSNIVIGVLVAENNVRFNISDTGTGIESQHIESLFRIDRKLTKKGTSNEKGTGLGLILCKEFIELHHGKIWVESEPGKGSCFSFTIPL